MTLRMFGIPRLDRKGSVSVVGALVLPLLIGMTGLVAEYGNGVLAKTRDQRVADLAAYAGAVAYNSTDSASTMTSVIDKVASLNGVSAADVTGALVTSPSGDGNQSVQVNINTTVPLIVSQVLRTGGSLPVQAVSYAELKANAQGCVIALQKNGTGVTLSGGTAITADQCAVNSNTTVTVPCGDTITTISVAYDSTSAPSQPCSGIQPPSGSALRIYRALTPDPLAANAGVLAATARESTVAAMSSPNAPSVSSGGDINFGYSQGSTESQVSADGCSASYASYTWTVTCANGGTYHLGNITTAGGITVNFNTGGSPATTYDFSGSITNTGTAMSFGPGIYNIAHGLTTGGGTTTTFAAGTYNMGASTSACSDGGNYSICNTGTNLTFGGPSTFNLSSGVYNKGGESLTLGSGSTNSFNIGASSNGNSVYVGGGSITVFADATGGSSVFDLVGNLNMGSGGGSCLSLGAAAQHDINGAVLTAGGTTLGSGVYTVHGYIALGGSGGGDVTCSGTVVGLNGTGVTLVTDGASTPSSGVCAGQAFCVAAGFGHVTVTAPTSGTTADLAVIGPISSGNSAGAAFAEGASNTSVSGAFYTPYGPITLTGSASIGSGSGQCLELIGSQVTMSGGTAVASKCVNTTVSNFSVVLVQ